MLAISSIRMQYDDVTTNPIWRTESGALVVTHAMLRRLTSRRCIIIIIMLKIVFWLYFN